jgi:hypothetical protein
MIEPRRKLRIESCSTFAPHAAPVQGVSQHLPRSGHSTHLSAKEQEDTLAISSPLASCRASTLMQRALRGAARRMTPALRRSGRRILGLQ